MWVSSVVAVPGVRKQWLMKGWFPMTDRIGLTVFFIPYALFEPGRSFMA